MMLFPLSQKKRCAMHTLPFLLLYYSFLLKNAPGIIPFFRPFVKQTKDKARTIFCVLYWLDFQVFKWGL